MEPSSLEIQCKECSYNYGQNGIRFSGPVELESELN